ncbi:hypothetical protein FGB62_243g08 [Gracilaria domingensis]|nr:hypothetical protein FGB62_243g08 [Gracilaria domingensis]
MRGMLQTLSGLEYPVREITTVRPTKERGWRTWWRCFGARRREEEQVNSKQIETDASVLDNKGAVGVAHDPGALSGTEDDESRLPPLTEKLRRPGIPERNGVPRPRVKRYRLIAPITIRFVVLLLELGAIYSSSNITDDVLAGHSFNVRLTKSNDTVNAAALQNSQCQEFIENARGVEQNGTVLLCIDSEETRDLTTRRENTSVFFRFNPNTNRMEYVVEDNFVMTTSVYARVFINLISDDNVELAPLRPDLDVDSNYSKVVIQGIMNRAMKKLGFDVNLSDINESEGDDNVITYGYDRFFDSSTRDDIGEALLSELQQFTLGLNFTEPGDEDVLYAFRADKGYFKHENAVIAVVGKNRLAQGWLIIAWVSLLVLRLIAQRFFTVFDELAYPAVKKVHGADLSVGPLAKVEKKETLYISKFSDGRVGHIGYRPANERQDRVSNFYGCDIVLGSGESLRRRSARRSPGESTR